MAAPGRLRTAATLALLIFIWGTTWAAIRIGLTGVPPWTGAALRFGLAAVLLLALAPVLGVKLGRSRLEWRLWGINALTTFTISYGMLYWCEQWVPSGLASVIFAAFPLFVAILSHCFLGERLGWRSAGGILVGFAGIAVLFAQDFTHLGGPQVTRAAILLLVSPFMAALGNVAMKKWGSDIHPLSVAAVPMGISSLLLGAVAWFLERGQPITWTPAAVGSIVYLAIFGSALSFTLYFWLLRYLAATSLSLITYGSPVVAVVIGTLWLAEPFTWHTAAGTALVLAGVGLALRKGKPPESGTLER
jgi:drug/metabolite transporter (DMT)-like permease